MPDKVHWEGGMHPIRNSASGVMMGKYERRRSIIFTMFVRSFIHSFTHFCPRERTFSEQSVCIKRCPWREWRLFSSKGWSSAIPARASPQPRFYRTVTAFKRPAAPAWSPQQPRYPLCYRRTHRYWRNVWSFICCDGESAILFPINNVPFSESPLQCEPCFCQQIVSIALEPKCIQISVSSKRKRKKKTRHKSCCV